MLPRKVTRHFQHIDAKLLEQIEEKEIAFSPSKRYFTDLCESIVSQQLSEKAAASIWKKFTKHIPSIDPASIASTDVSVFRSIGMSWSKASYLHNVAEAFRNGLVTPEHFEDMADEEIITQLVQIKGVGRWTAEMFLMFSLGREDVFSADDLGLRKGLQKLVGMKTLPKKQTMQRVSKKWSPYRTYAALILWKSLEQKDMKNGKG